MCVCIFNLILCWYSNYVQGLEGYGTMEVASHLHTSLIDQLIDSQLAVYSNLSKRCFSIARKDKKRQTIYNLAGGYHKHLHFLSELCVCVYFLFKAFWLAPMARVSI